MLPSGVSQLIKASSLASTLCVHAASPVLAVAPQNTAVDVLRNVTLACRAVGKPQPTVRWSRHAVVPRDQVTRPPVGDVEQSAPSERLNYSVSADENHQSAQQQQQQRFSVDDDGSLSIHRQLFTEHS